LSGEGVRRSKQEEVTRHYLPRYSPMSGDDTELPLYARRKSQQASVANGTNVADASRPGVAVNVYTHDMRFTYCVSRAHRHVSTRQDGMSGSGGVSTRHCQTKEPNAVKYEHAGVWEGRRARKFISKSLEESGSKSLGEGESVGEREKQHDAFHGNVHT
jgi:hypothetical protein